MPVMAARLPDVAVPHPHPAVLLRLEQHLLDQAAVLLLHERPVRQLAAVHLEPLRQLVAHALELAEAEYPGAAARGHLPVAARARVSGAEEAPPCRRTGRREDASRRPPRSRRRAGPGRRRPAALPRWPAAARGRPPHARRRMRAAARRSPPWRS